MRIYTKESEINAVIIGRGKKERLLVSTNNEKNNILEIIKNKEKNIEIEKIFSNYKFYIDGNKSKPNIDFITDYIICREDISFTNEIALNFKSMLEQTDKNLRFLLLKTIMSDKLQAEMPKHILENILNKTGLEFNSKIKTIDDKEVKIIADIMDKTTKEVYKSLYVSSSETKIVQGFNSKMIKNFAKNLNNTFAKSKSKKMKKINPRIYADPKLSEINIYNSRLRPDLVIEVNEGNERKRIVGEIFDWTKSCSYISRQFRKIKLAIDFGIPYFTISSSKNNLHKKILEKNISKEYESKSILLQSVARWTEENLYIPSKNQTIVDSMYFAFVDMMDYAGLNKYIPTDIIKAFEK